MKISTLIILLCIVLKINAFGQSAQADQMQHIKDSVKMAYLSKMSIKNPSLRQASFSAEVITKNNFDSELYDSPLLDGQIQIQRYSAQTSFHLFSVGKNKISATVGGEHQVFMLDDIQSYNTLIDFEERNINKYLAKGALTISRMDTIFSKPLVSHINLSGIVDPETGQHRLMATGLFLSSIKRTKKSHFSVGLVLSSDPSSPSPVIPFIMYSHTFDPSLELSLGISGINLRKQLNDKSSLAFSNKLSGSLAFLQFEENILPKESLYSSLELQSGLTYERLITPKMIFSFSSGINSVFSSKVLEQNKISDPFIKNHQKMTPYVKFELSFLPFWKGLFK
ncbi:DUF6268 family outer membrane beta-barrel protein [Fulvivirga maritima]|uniref:DUF6268 family outer membrane beta-barrel protein n=1 Tax=Fulvivirga maritima TaxID=2904247 RepID=UPI001F268198|nr:DUF6268 family outer membrane beta-barrel protein [Fulvivirga maritima]UII25596.1 DUF6268 family outer membrane beta-barrel protein [Fulvivirga maritima]